MNTEILILDDEPHNISWLPEYLADKGYTCTNATNIKDASELLSTKIFRAIVVDLNVPAPGEYSSALAAKGEVYAKYRGLYFAEHARTLGYRNMQVIVYSVHDIDEVRLVTDRIRIKYATKGRPRDFKALIDEVLSYDPTQGI
jgi:CheY-like chemotaxis protein